MSVQVRLAVDNKITNFTAYLDYSFGKRPLVFHIQCDIVTGFFCFYDSLCLLLILVTLSVYLGFLTCWNRNRSKMCAKS